MILHRALQYKSWADRRTLDAVAAIDGRKYAAAMAFARQQLNHMVRVEELFRARLLAARDPHGTTNTDDVPALDELDRRLSASNAWLRTYVQTVSTAQLEEMIQFAFVDGQRGAMTREEMLFHLVNHGTYHRGAIGHALDLAKAPRPADTYTVFVHAAEPRRREP